MWGFRTLLGYCYVQAVAVLISGELPRCERCAAFVPDGALPSLDGPVISAARLGRKGRTDRRFCSVACRVAHKRDAAP